MDMRGNCPERILSELQPDLAVEYWGRRAAFEFIEELADAIFIGWVLGSIFYGLSQLGDRGQLIWQWLVVGAVLIFIWPLRMFFFEWLRWRNEIYVVARNDERGGGQVYKFWGAVNYKKLYDPITDRSPTISTAYPVNYRLWGFFTGERMMRIHLSSDNNAFIDGRKVSPELEHAIQRVRASEPRSTIQEFEEGIQWTREIDRLTSRGRLNTEEGERYIQEIVRGVVWG